MVRREGPLRTLLGGLTAVLLLAGLLAASAAPAGADPTLTTTATATAEVGGSISDTAVLAGGVDPTGSITFNLYGPADATCAGPAVFTSTKPVTGNGSYTSDSFTPAAPGTYLWTASYSGDGNNVAATSPCNAAGESSVVSTATTTIATSATASVTVGNPISDTATVTGVNPTGTVTFNVYGPDDPTCGGAPVFTAANVTLTAGTAASGDFTPTTAGTYRWVASYSGDANNAPSAGTCNDPNETSVVTKAVPTIATLATSIATVGNPISDSATVSGGFSPTGTVTFTLYGPDDATCTGTAVFTASNVALSSGTAGSGTFTPTTAGTYRWVASYSGDANNEAVTSPCNDVNETTTVARATPAISTTATATVTIGSPVSDTALLVGGFSPTGNITFRLYGPNDATCAGSPAFTSTKTVSGNASYTSDAFTPTSAGTYFWTAVYSGDGNNDPATGVCNAIGETSNVLTAQPLLVTSATQAAAVGAAIADTATLSAGLSPTGTLTFRLFGPDNATCTGAPAFTTTVTVAGNGSYTSAPFTVPSVGTWRWVASYGGDGNNGAATGICNGANENTTVVKASPGITASASLAGDQVVAAATLSGGFNPTGTITFTLYGPSSASCSGAPLFTSTKAVGANGAYQSDPFTPPGPGTYRWVAGYGGDANHNGTGTNCDAAAVTVPPRPAALSPAQGYWLTGTDGGVFGFGGARFFGSTGGLRLAQPVVAMAATPTNQGYWLVAADGGVFAFGDAVFQGSMGGTRLNQRIVGMAPTPSGRGYWLVGADGGVFAFGDAVFQGSMGGTRLNQRIVGMAATPSGRGYWMVAADGGVFAFGDAVFLGSMGGTRLAQPVVGMAAARSGLGYRLVAADGGIFAFGTATFHGSTGAIRLAQPIVAVVSTRSGAGYWLGAADGGVFAFGDAVFGGSAGAIRLAAPVTAMAAEQ